MRLRYSLTNLRRARRMSDVLKPTRAVTLLMMTLIAVVGEVCGYALGAGKSPLVMLDFEFGRYRQMRPSDFRHGISVGEVILPLRSPRAAVQAVQETAAKDVVAA
jgi:hypothetical protein